MKRVEIKAYELLDLGMEELIQMLRFYSVDCNTCINQPFVNHVDSNLHRSCPGALARPTL
jgi:hypothetical protein